MKLNNTIRYLAILFILQCFEMKAVEINVVIPYLNTEVNVDLNEDQPIAEQVLRVVESHLGLRAKNVVFKSGWVLTLETYKNLLWADPQTLTIRGPHAVKATIIYPDGSEQEQWIENYTSSNGKWFRTVWLRELFPFFNLTSDNGPLDMNKGVVANHVKPGDRIYAEYVDFISTNESIMIKRPDGSVTIHVNVDHIEMTGKQLLEQFHLTGYNLFRAIDNSPLLPAFTLGFYGIQPGETLIARKFSKGTSNSGTVIVRKFTKNPHNPSLNSNQDTDSFDSHPLKHKILERRERFLKNIAAMHNNRKYFRKK